MDANAHEIIPGIWLGNRVAAADAHWLRDNRIEVVFNCTKDLPFKKDYNCHRYRLPVDDNLDPVEINNMGKWAAEAVSKAYLEWGAGRPMLIHCFAGRQRSAAVVAMLLIVILEKSNDEIMNYIRAKRPVAFFPSPNFLPAIQKFETDYTAALQNNKPIT